MSSSLKSRKLFLTLKSFTFVAGDGVAKFDSVSWQIDQELAVESGPDDYINCITHNSEDHIYIGKDGKGMAKFDGVKWEYFTNDNSPLPDDKVEALILRLRR